MVHLFLKFKSRRLGRFGNSPLGRVLEWLTITWLRFTCSLVSVSFLVFIPFVNLPADEKLLLILLAPIGAVIYWYIFLFLLLISEYLGTFGKILAHVLIVYFYLFSRFVVQQPPIVDLSLTKR